jgi:hypothetical protein
MKHVALIFLSSFFCCVTNAQSKLIEKVFRLLPADKIYHLSVATRDSMLNGKTYYHASNSSSEIAAYNYGESTNVNDYLYVSFSFETDQGGSGMIEIRSFKMLNGDKLIVVSKSGGVWQVAYNQQDISFFIFDKYQKLVPYKKKILPAANENLFMKAGIPDSIKRTILNNSNMTFDLSHEKLMLALNSNYISNDEKLSKWLKVDEIYFNWVGDHFVCED